MRRLIRLVFSDIRRIINIRTVLACLLCFCAAAFILSKRVVPDENMPSPADEFTARLFGGYVPELGDSIQIELPASLLLYTGLLACGGIITQDGLRRRGQLLMRCGSRSVLFCAQSVQSAVLAVLWNVIGAAVDMVLCLLLYGETGDIGCLMRGAGLHFSACLLLLMLMLSLSFLSGRAAVTCFLCEAVLLICIAAGTVLPQLPFASASLRRVNAGIIDFCTGLIVNFVSATVIFALYMPLQRLGDAREVL